MIQVVRVGHPARLEPAVLQHSLDAIVASSDSAEIILDVRQDLDKAYVCVYGLSQMCKLIICITIRCSAEEPVIKRNGALR